VAEGPSGRFEKASSGRRPARKMAPRFLWSRTSGQLLNTSRDTPAAMTSSSSKARRKCLHSPVEERSGRQWARQGPTLFRQWLQTAEHQLARSFEGNIFLRFYRDESIGELTITAQYVSTVFKRRAETARLDPEAYSAHSLRAGYIMQAIRAGKAERRVREHSGHTSWETVTSAPEEAEPFRTPPARESVYRTLFLPSFVTSGERMALPLLQLK